MIQDVEKFETKLQINLLVKVELLRQVDVRVEIVRTENGIHARGAERTGRVRNIRFGIDPQPRRLIPHVAGGPGNHIGSIQSNAGNEASVPVSGLKGNPL